MEKRYDIVEIKENVLADNDRVAGKIREELRRSNTCFINLMASPGAGKTSLLIKTIEALKDKIAGLERQVDNLKLTQAFSSAEGGNPAAKEKIDKMLKALDKCIAQLER